ncbi:hypothetical protein SLNSH_20810 [Alsobacter soli]|uniref:Uncharacterized protein n=1 Tax=Alsobacter soli TaxID=2109933 RepID=A0A2T1HN62_9HYPH|nr:hypothetical protein [Alsobacter soli]PSC03067.1 hypothetical protein SLNSH_20810 [Alsobacter soli]
MAFVGVLVDEKGKDTVGTALTTTPDARGNEYSRAVDDLKTRKLLDDPSSAKMFADHFAEITIGKILDQDEAAAGHAADALVAVMGHDFLLVRASKLRDDLEIVDIKRLEADNLEQAEEIWSSTLEQLLTEKKGH